MPETRKATFGFTKLIVDDVEKMAAFYHEVYGLNALQRVQARIGDEPISEIIMGPGDRMSAESLVMLKYLNRPTPPRGELILGFITADLAALVRRVQGAGGKVLQQPHDVPEHGVRVAFVTDPEGHLAEVVQMLGQSA
jgi:predicted enzyme related to lactoylglutathione lyase